MTHVSFEEYEAAKAEIIGGGQYKEDSTLEGSTIRKTYTTERGTFYEVNDGGRVEFWSDKHPESRIYDENERAEARRPRNNRAGPRLRRIVVGQDQDHDAGLFKAERL